MRMQVCYLRHAFGLGEHYNSLAVVNASEAAVGESETAGSETA